MAKNKLTFDHSKHLTYEVFEVTKKRDGEIDDAVSDAFLESLKKDGGEGGTVRWSMVIEHSVRTLGTMTPAEYILLGIAVQHMRERLKKFSAK